MENNYHFVARNLEFTKLTMHKFEKLFVNFFYAPKLAQSEELLSSLKSIASFYTDAIYVFIDIEKCPDLVKAFDVLVVPSIVLSDANKKVLKRLENPQMNELILNLEDDIALFKTNFAVEKERMFAKIEKILDVSQVMVFIKGTPLEPKCGFTSSLLEIMKSFGLNFGYFNILEDEDVRNWLRYYAKWNTYPQLHINKKIIGGLDVVKDLVANNKFLELIPETAKKGDPSIKFNRILEECKGKIVVFMGDLAADESKKMAKLLKDNGVKFVVSEVMGDKNLEQYILGKYNEKSLPLCFINGEFVGRFDTLYEICQKKKLLPMVSQFEWSLNPRQKFEFLINSFAVICFIEGNYDDKGKTENQKVFEILRKNNIEFEYFNVEFDIDVKDIVKEFSGLSGFPQIFHNKKVVGGMKLLEKIEKEGDIKHLFQ